MRKGLRVHRPAMLLSSLLLLVPFSVRAQTTSVQLFAPNQACPSQDGFTALESLSADNFAQVGAGVRLVTGETLTKNVWNITTDSVTLHQSLSSEPSFIVFKDRPVPAFVLKGIVEVPTRPATVGTGGSFGWVFDYRNPLTHNLVGSSASVEFDPSLLSYDMMAILWHGDPSARRGTGFQLQRI